MNRTVLIAIGAAVVLVILWFAFTGPSPEPVAETEQPMAPAPGAEPATGAVDAEPPATEQAETDPLTGDQAADDTPADMPQTDEDTATAPAN
jgi:type II secretory pathway component PulM